MKIENYIELVDDVDFKKLNHIESVMVRRKQEKNSEDEETKQQIISYMICNNLVKLGRIQNLNYPKWENMPQDQKLEILTYKDEAKAIKSMIEYGIKMLPPIVKDLRNRKLECPLELPISIDEYEKEKNSQEHTQIFKLLCWLFAFKEELEDYSLIKSTGQIMQVLNEYKPLGEKGEYPFYWNTLEQIYTTTTSTTRKSTAKLQKNLNDIPALAAVVYSPEALAVNILYLDVKFPLNLIKIIHEYLYSLKIDWGNKRTLDFLFLSENNTDRPLRVKELKVTPPTGLGCFYNYEEILERLYERSEIGILVNSCTRTQLQRYEQEKYDNCQYSR